MDEATIKRVRELLLRARDLEKEAAGLREVVRRLIGTEVQSNGESCTALPLDLRRS